MGFVVKPIAVDTTILESSNVAEDDHPVWNGSTTYALGARVIVTGTTNRVFESLIGSNSGNDPTTDDGSRWLNVSATNRWKAFDERLSDQVERATSIEYSFRVPDDELVSAITCFNVEADTIRVQIFNSDDPEVEVYNEVVSSVASTQVIDWYTWAFGEFDPSSEVLFLDQPGVQDLPGHEGYRILVTITRTGGAAKVGQIVLGRILPLGRSVDGTRVGLRDFSVKETDEFGNVTLLKRGFSREVDFEMIFPTLGAQRLTKILDENRAENLVWSTGANPAVGTTVFGFFQNYDLRLRPAESRAFITVQGLV